MSKCYQCGGEVAYLFEDRRCHKCTRLTPEEVQGEPPWILCQTCGYMFSQGEYEAVGKFGCPNCNGEKL